MLDGLHALASSDWGVTDELDPRVRRLSGSLVASYLTYHLGRPLTAWELVPR